MAEITSIEKMRNRRAKRRRIFRLVLAAVLILAALLVVFNWDNLQQLGADQVMDSGLAEEMENHRFPITLPSANAYRMEPVGDGLALLTDSRLYFYNRGGKLLSSYQHGIASPSIAVGGGTAAVYQQDTTQIQLFPFKGSSWTLETDSAILSVVLSDKGEICVLQSAQRYVSELVVYSKKGQEMFRWSSQNIMVDACFIGEDRIAASCLSTVGGAIQSSVSFYSLHQEEPYAQAEFSENLLLSLDAKSDGTVVAVGDQSAVAFNSQGEQIRTYSYQRDGLAYFDNSQDLVVLVLGDYTKYKANDIVFLDQHLQVRKVYTSHNRITDLAVGSSKGAALLEGNLLLFQTEDNSLHLYVTQYDRMEAAFLGNTLLLRGDEEIVNNEPKASSETHTPEGNRDPGAENQSGSQLPPSVPENQGGGIKGPGKGAPDTELKHPAPELLRPNFDPEPEPESQPDSEPSAVLPEESTPQPNSTPSEPAEEKPGTLTEVG